jgi:four helix bundle protein
VSATRFVMSPAPGGPMTNDEARMTNEGKKTEGVRAGKASGEFRPGLGRVYDLEDRTSRFGEAIIDFAKCVPVNPVTRSLIDQLVRSGTSVGANYVEADDAGSGNDFRYKIGICKRESRETKYWLRMIARAVPALKGDARALWREARDLHLIFAKIWRKCVRK